MQSGKVVFPNCAGSKHGVQEMGGIERERASDSIEEVVEPVSVEEGRCSDGNAKCRK